MFPQCLSVASEASQRNKKCCIQLITSHDKKYCDGKTNDKMPYWPLCWHLQWAKPNDSNSWTFGPSNYDELLWPDADLICLFRTVLVSGPATYAVPFDYSKNLLLPFQSLGSNGGCHSPFISPQFQTTIQCSCVLPLHWRVGNMGPSSEW